MATGAEATQGELYCPTCEQTFARGERCPNDNTRLVRIAGATDKLIGRELDGRYTIVEKLGQGGMGAVYRGTQHSVGREVAIKVVTPSLVADGVAIKRFLREAKLASRLSHPNAVSVLDFGQTDDGLFYLIMELVVGRTLDKVIEDDRVLPPARLVRIGSQICDALEGAHALHIVHRDLKPQNVMIMSTGRDLVKVLDFGLAKSLTPDPGTTTMTNAGALLGTPAFMPPELVTGQDCDARADLYSLGCLLYVCATGRPPFSASSIHELIAMHASEPPPPMVGLPVRLAAVIERLLEKEPARRFQTAAQAREALEATSTAEPAGVVADQPDDSTMTSGPATMLGWTNTTPGQAVMRPSAARVRVATPVGGMPRVATPVGGVPRVAVPPGGPGRIATPVGGVPRVAPPVGGVSRIATPAAGVPRLATPASGVARVPAPGSGAVRIAGASLSPASAPVAPYVADAAVSGAPASTPLVQSSPMQLASELYATPGVPTASEVEAATASDLAPRAKHRVSMIVAGAIVIVAAAVIAFVAVGGKTADTNAPATPAAETPASVPAAAAPSAPAPAVSGTDTPRAPPAPAAGAPPTETAPAAASPATASDATTDPGPAIESPAPAVRKPAKPVRPRAVGRPATKPKPKQPTKREPRSTPPKPAPRDPHPTNRPVVINPGVM